MKQGRDFKKNLMNFLVTNHPLLGNMERVKRREYGRNKKNL